jgi:WXXGXW repeat (2 copies)
MRTVRFLCLLLSLVLLVLARPARSSAGVRISITIAPPALPVYVQPVCPGGGYIWTPGYWAYGDDGYYWVPGTWVLAPEVGFLWTPGYWGWADGVYIWHAGYWGRRVGFYGGIDYGFGYTGVGYAGGYWSSGHFFYNRDVNNVNVVVIHNTYGEAVINHSVSRASFNGGNGGTTSRPSSADVAAARERHIRATSAQVRQQREASRDRSQFASVNRGRPAIAATAKPGDFSGHGVIAAKASGGRYVPASNRSTNRVSSNASSTELRPSERRSGARESRPTAHINKATPKRSAAPHRETNPSVRLSHAGAHETRPSTVRERTVQPREHIGQPRKEAKPASPHVSVPQHESSPTRHESAFRSEHAAHAAPQRSSAPSRPHASRPPAQHKTTPRSQSKPEERKSEGPQ